MTIPTRIISWQQQVLEADPEWPRSNRQPWIYELSNGRLFYQRADSPYAPLPSSGLANDGGVLQLLDASGYPTSAAGLSPGAVWDDGGVIAVVSGASPQPGVPPLLYSNITASELLLFGGANLPLSNPGSGSGKLWNNGGLVCIA